MTKLISHQGKTMLQSQIDRTEQPPPPAVVRLGAPRGAPSCFAAAFDTMIMAMHVEGPYDDDDDDDDRGGDTHLLPESLVPVFDVRSRPSGHHLRPSAQRRSRPPHLHLDREQGVH